MCTKCIANSNGKGISEGGGSGEPERLATARFTSRKRPRKRQSQ